MQRIIKKLKDNLIYVFIIILCVLPLFCGGAVNAAAETTTVYSDVLEDLQQDENFNADDYPEDLTDFSLNVIQIAESSDGELFIYVYQPYTGSEYDLTAKSINISMSTDGTLKYINYRLILINSSGTLHKYKVNGIMLSSDSERVYNISAIYRAYIEELDGEVDGDNTVSETACVVAKEWTVVTDSDSGDVYYYMTETQVVVVTDKHVGYIRYWSGFSSKFFSSTSSNSYIDSHYVAFSTDYEIDELYEADLYYITQSHYIRHVGGYEKTNEYGEEVENYLTLTYTDSVEYTSGYYGFFRRNKYTWDRIQTIEEFSNDDGVSLTSDAAEDIAGMQWVLRFTETEFSYSINDSEYSSTETWESTVVSDVTILRLKFLCDGTVYNLGVVDNKQSGSLMPDGIGTGEVLYWYDNLWIAIKDFFSDLFDFDFGSLWNIILSVIKIIIIAVLIGVVIWLIALCWPVIKLIFKAIAAPFKAIAKLIKQRRQDKAIKGN